MRDQLQEIFGPADGPMTLPSKFHELLQFDPIAGGEVVLGGIQAFLDWLLNYLLTEPLSAIGMLALIVIVVFTIPYRGERPS